MIAAIQRFIPLTFQMGFLEAPFERVVDTYLEWWRTIDSKYGEGRTETRYVNRGIESLLELQPLTTPICRNLILETRSRWTAFFDNGSRVSDPGSPVGHLCTIVPCRGVVICCTPDRSTVSHPEALRNYGAVMFTIYSAKETDRLNRERSVGVMNDGGRWKFWAEGTVQSFEDVKQYAARRIQQKFTCETLNQYCVAMGIHPFDEEFFGLRGLIADRQSMLVRDAHSISLDDARRLAQLR